MTRGGVAVLLWGLLGFTGAHRFYLGHVRSGALYACTLGLLGLGWLFDAFLLRHLISEARPRPSSLEMQDAPPMPEEKDVAPIKLAEPTQELKPEPEPELSAKKEKKKEEEVEEEGSAEEVLEAVHSRLRKAKKTSEAAVDDEKKKAGGRGGGPPRELQAGGTRKRTRAAKLPHRKEMPAGRLTRTAASTISSSLSSSVLVNVATAPLAQAAPAPPGSVAPFAGVSPHTLPPPSLPPAPSVSEKGASLLLPPAVSPTMADTTALSLPSDDELMVEDRIIPQQ
jgi:hypothetical protein